MTQSTVVTIVIIAAAIIYICLFVVVGGVVGILTGLMSGQVVRVWRDHNTGAVYQRGGWSYVMVLVGLLIARLIIYIVLRYSGVVTGFGPINFAFIALALGNYLGRSINVHLRTQRLMLQVV